MLNTDWKRAKEIFESWNVGDITLENARDLMYDAKVPAADIDCIFSPNSKFNNNFGGFATTKFFANTESGDLYLLNWLQNVPTLYSWVEISEAAWKTWSRW